MADRIDIDADPLSGEACPPFDRKRTLRSGTGTTTAKEGDLSELPKLKQGALSATFQMDQSVQPSGQPPVKKQRMTVTQQLPQSIGLTSSQRNNQRGADKADADRLRVRLHVSQAENFANKRKIGKLRAKIDSVQETNRQLDRWVRRGQKEHGNLIDKNNDLKQDLEKEKENHAKDNAQLQARINDLVQTNDRLRQMIVPVSEEQVLDSDVVSRFISLRQSILALVRQTWRPILKSDVDFGRLSQNQQDIFAGSVPISYDRLRHLVSQGVCFFILDSQCYFLGDGSMQLEQRLQRVEKDLERNVSRANDRRLVMEWRISTFKATEKFRDHDNQLSRETRNRIWSFLDCIQVKDAAAEKKGKKTLKAICDSAVELGLMVRQLKDEFKIDILEDAVGQHISDWENWADETASVPAPPGIDPGTIAYVIAGALFKRPKEDLERVLILEKAEVAVYE